MSIIATSDLGKNICSFITRKESIRYKGTFFAPGMLVTRLKNPDLIETITTIGVINEKREHQEGKAAVIFERDRGWDLCENLTVVPKPVVIISTMDQGRCTFVNRAEYIRQDGVLFYSGMRVRSRRKDYKNVHKTVVAVGYLDATHGLAGAPSVVYKDGGWDRCESIEPVA